MLNKKMIIGIGVLTVSAVAAGFSMFLHGKKKAMIEVVNDETDEFKEEEVEVTEE